MRVAVLIASGLAAAVAVAASTAGGGVAMSQTPADPPETTTSPKPPVNELLPEVNGRMREGEVVRVSPGRWAGAELLDFANRWDRCDTERCRPIGVDGFLYRLAAADVGHRMRGVVTASNVAGTAFAVGRQSALVKAKLRPIEPFPVIAIRGYITRRGTLLTRLAARAPAGSLLSLRCRGSGCPFRRARRRFRRHFVAVRSLRRRTMQDGAVVELRVTNGDTIGKYARFRFRRGRRPARVDLCVTPDAPSPIRCPRIRPDEARPAS